MLYQYTIISRWRNREKVEELTRKIREKGKSVYSFIEGDGSKHELKDSEQKYQPEEFMQKYESIPDWRNDPQIREIFEIDMKALRNAETVILLLPAGKSAHIEAGVGYGLGKHMIVIGEQKETESLYLIFNEFYDSIDDFIKSL
jgi:nucleoside 2-deoxyribosyltransferase